MNKYLKNFLLGILLVFNALNNTYAGTDSLPANEPKKIVEENAGLFGQLSNSASNSFGSLKDSLGYFATGAVRLVSFSYFFSDEEKKLHLESENSKSNTPVDTYAQGRILSIRYTENSSNFDSPLSSKDAVKLTIKLNSTPFFMDKTDETVITVWSKDSEIIKKIRNNQIAKDKNYVFAIGQHFIGQDILNAIKTGSLEQVSMLAFSDHNRPAAGNNLELLEIMTPAEALNRSKSVISQQYQGHSYVIDTSLSEKKLESTKFRSVKGKIVRVIDSYTTFSLNHDKKCLISLLREYKNGNSEVSRFVSKDVMLCALSQISLMTGLETTIIFDPVNYQGTVDAYHYQIFGVNVHGINPVLGSLAKPNIPIGTVLVDKAHAVVKPLNSSPISSDEKLELSNVIDDALVNVQSNYATEFLKTQEQEDKKFHEEKEKKAEKIAAQARLDAENAAKEAQQKSTQQAMEKAKQATLKAQEEEKKKQQASIEKQKSARSSEEAKKSLKLKTQDAQQLKRAELFRRRQAVKEHKM